MRKVRKPLNRKMYEKIRKMDHNDMARYIESVYQEGVTNGSKTNITLDEIRLVLSEIKGIGEKKTDAIIEALSKLQIKSS